MVEILYDGGGAIEVAGEDSDINTPLNASNKRGSWSKNGNRRCVRSWCYCDCNRYIFKSVILVGNSVNSSGPNGLKPADRLSKSLEDLGLKLAAVKNRNPASNT